MKKTDNFFLIHNFNTVPTELLEFCEHYMIYDASTEESVKQSLKDKELRHRTIPNTGHNITTYFSYFDRYYDELPEVICLLKGNMIGRHCTKGYFEKVYDQKYFTYLYDDRKSSHMFEKQGDIPRKKGLFSVGSGNLVSENQYIEVNNSWYVSSPNHPHRYSANYDDMLRLIWKEPIIPKFCLFAPGACYIVRREQVRKHSREFYRNLNKIMNYAMEPNFPSEAHQIERMLPLIFESTYEENPWMQDEAAFEKQLLKMQKKVQAIDEWESKRLKRIRRLFGEGPKW